MGAWVFLSLVHRPLEYRLSLSGSLTDAIYLEMSPNCNEWIVTVADQLALSCSPPGRYSVPISTHWYLSFVVNDLYPLAPLHFSSTLEPKV